MNLKIKGLKIRVCCKDSIHLTYKTFYTCRIIVLSFYVKEKYLYTVSDSDFWAFFTRESISLIYILHLFYITLPYVTVCFIGLHGSNIKCQKVHCGFWVDYEYCVKQAEMVKFIRNHWNYFVTS